MENTVTSKKRRLSSSKGILLVGAVSAGLVLLLSLLVFLRYRSFLRSSSYDFVKEYLSNADEDALFTVAEEYLSREISTYEDRTSVFVCMKELLHPQNITFARADTYTEKNPVYTLYANGKEAFTLTLSGRGTLFGHPAWKIKELTVSEESRIGTPFVLEVPHGASVIVNGIEPDPSIADPVPYHALSPFEPSLSEEIYSDCYSLGTFFLSPDVSVVLDGKRLPADTVEGEILRYRYPAGMTSSATITVPYGSVLTVNGLAVGDLYCIETGISYPFLTRFEENLPGLPTAIVYQISDLFCTPEVLVSYHDTPLVPKEGTYTYYLPEAMTKRLVIAAPSYAIVKINGSTVSGAERTAEWLELPIMEGVSGYAKDRPYMNEYTITGLLTEPTITATDQNGYSLPVSSYYSTEDRIVFTCTPSEDMQSKDKTTLTTFAKRYVNYVYSAYTGLDANYSSIISLTPGSSPAYKALQKTFYTLYNAPRHKSISYLNVEFLSYYRYSSSSHSSILKITFLTTYSGQRYYHEMTLDVLYVYSGNSRRIINYTVLNTISMPAA